MYFDVIKEHEHFFFLVDLLHLKLTKGTTKMKHYEKICNPFAIDGQSVAILEHYVFIPNDNCLINSFPNKTKTVRLEL